MFRWFLCGAVAGLLLMAPAHPSAQADPHATFDKILDTYVRDGYVYYLALQKERGPLDRYIASLDVPRPRIDAWPKADQEAYWINAYNAFVLATVIGAYPIKVRSAEFPAKSIRQIPGAFEAIKHRVAGEMMTLDEIEKNVIGKFGDGRLLLALGRGAIGSGRLHSEAFQGAALERQLTDVARECAARVACVKIDRAEGVMEVSPLFGWRQEVFTATDDPASQRWANRSPLERAVTALIYPHVFPSERQFLELNTFRMTYSTFDWRLNDLTGGVPN
jgi:hypothetical protein